MASQARFGTCWACPVARESRGYPLEEGPTAGRGLGSVGESSKGARGEGTPLGTQEAGGEGTPLGTQEAGGEGTLWGWIGESGRECLHRHSAPLSRSRAECCRERRRGEHRTWFSSGGGARPPGWRNPG